MMRGSGRKSRFLATVVGGALAFIVTTTTKPVLAQVSAVQASQVMLWNITPPGSGALGGLSVSPTANKLLFTPAPYTMADGLLLIDPATGNYQTTPTAMLVDAHMPVWVSTELDEDFLIGGAQNFQAFSLDGTLLWQLPWGCCNVPHAPPSIDFAHHAVGKLRGYGLADFDLSNGNQTDYISGIGGAYDGFTSVASADNVYAAYAGLAGITSYDPSAGTRNFDFVAISGSASSATRAVAVAADGSAVVTTGADHFAGASPDPGGLARVAASGTVLWNIAANAVTPAVIGGDGTIYIGTQAPSASNGAIEAHDPNSGALLWTQPVVSTPQDLLVADNGQIYAIAADSYSPITGEVYGFDQKTGSPSLNLTGVPGAYEIILQNGVIYVSGRYVTALPVPANGYDPQSPWPVRFHDNQRTGNATAPLNLGNFPGSDRTPPTISISSPGPNVYLLNQLVTASYSCTDDTQVSSCTGSVPNGSPIDTSSVGTKTLTVTAVDSGGLTSTQSVTYTVAYNTCALYDQSTSVKSGATLPVKLELCDANMVDESTSTTVVHASSLTQTSTDAAETIQDSGNSNPDNDFRFDSTLGTSGGYIFNLKTTGYATGTYSLQLSAAGDPTSHSVMFQVR